jgi:hypothetical protein
MTDRGGTCAIDRYGFADGGPKEQARACLENPA